MARTRGVWSFFAEAAATHALLFSIVMVRLYCSVLAHWRVLISSCPKNRTTQLAGCLRYLALAIMWNLVPLCAAAVLAILISTDQGQELLKIDRELAPGILQQFRRIGLPLTLYAILVTLACMVVAWAGTRRLTDIAQRYRLPEGPLRRLSRVVLPLAIGYAPILLIGFAVEHTWWIVPMAAVASTAVISPWLIKEVRPSPTIKPATKFNRNGPTIALALILAVFSAGAAAMALQPEEARAVGSIGVAVAGLAFWTAVLLLLFVAFPLRLGLPGLAVLAPLPWLVASYVHDPNQFPRRDAVGMPREVATSRQIAGVESQFVRWMLSRRFDHEGPISVYLISAEGGGLRGAYWSARVLTELNARSGARFAQQAFAYSGVSGGSLGIAAFLGMISKRPDEAIKAVEELLGRDYLAPLVGRLLLAEPFWQLAGRYSGVLPRDVALERQWEEDWQSSQPLPYFSKPFLQTFPAGVGEPGPAVIFNATNSETGKRVLLANVDAGVVANDYLFPLSINGVREQLDDITVGEVVHLSARFPFVSPPASFQMLVPAGKEQRPALRLWGHVVDGGYFDNSGGLALRDVYESLAMLRDAAQRGEGFLSGEPDLDWERARPLIGRAWFHIIVLRNDPLSSKEAERNDYPTLSDNRLVNLSGDETEKAWKAGEFSRSTPLRSKASELLAPLATVMTTREARASATRRALWERVTRGTHDQRYQCEIARRITDKEPVEFPLSFSPKCLGVRGDRYTEISLGAIVTEMSGEAAADAGACNLEDARGVALGWVLSETSKRAMSCLVSKHAEIRELAVELIPLQ